MVAFPGTLSVRELDEDGGGLPQINLSEKEGALDFFFLPEKPRAIPGNFLKDPAKRWTETVGCFFFYHFLLSLETFKSI